MLEICPGPFPIHRFPNNFQLSPVEGDEAAKLIYTHPDLLSLEEIYAVARYYRPGTEQYREVYEIAAFHFPDDVVANVNAASAVMLTGDLTSAWDYLRKVEADPRAWNNLGVLTRHCRRPPGCPRGRPYIHPPPGCPASRGYCRHGGVRRPAVHPRCRTGTAGGCRRRPVAGSRYRCLHTNSPGGAGRYGAERRHIRCPSGIPDEHRSAVLR